MNPSCAPAALYIRFCIGSVNFSFLGYAARNSSHGFFRLHSTIGEGKYWSQCIFNVD